MLQNDYLVCRSNISADKAENGPRFGTCCQICQMFSEVRVKTIPPVDDYEEPPPPPPPPPPPHIKTAKELNEEYLNEKRKENEDFFKVCHDATVTHIIPDKGHKGNKNFVPGGEIKMTDFSSGKSHHKLPSSLEWAKLREARRKQVQAV